MLDRIRRTIRAARNEWNRPERSAGPSQNVVIQLSGNVTDTAARQQLVQTRGTQYRWSR